MTSNNMNIDEFFALCDVLNAWTMLKQIEIVFHIWDTDIFVPQYGNPYVQSNNVYEQNLFHTVCKYVAFHPYAFAFCDFSDLVVD